MSEKKPADVLILSDDQVDAVVDGGVAKLETDERIYLLARDEIADVVVDAVDGSDATVNRLDADRDVV